MKQSDLTLSEQDFANGKITLSGEGRHHVSRTARSNTPKGRMTQAGVNRTKVIEDYKTWSRKGTIGFSSFALRCGGNAGEDSNDPFNKGLAKARALLPNQMIWHAANFRTGILRKVVVSS